MMAAGISFARLLPYVLFLPLSGVLADRYNRRALMLLADAGRAVCMIGLLLATSAATIWLDFPLVFLATCLGSLFRPALSATVPAVVGDEKRLTQANALMGQIDGLSLVLGPALAGVLILCGEARAAFAINAVTYAVSAMTLLRLRVPPRPASLPTPERGWLDEVLVGAHFLFRARGGALGAVTLSTAGLTACNGAAWTLLVALATQTWHFGSQGTGFLLAGYGLGGVCGGFLAGVATRRLAPTVAFAGSLAVGGLAILFLGLSPAGIVPFALLAGFGVADMINQVIGNTILQTATPDALLGRVFGAFEAILVSATVLGALATGPLLGTIGPRATTVTLAAIALGTLLIALPRLRALEHKTPAVESVSTPLSLAS
jgi:MFS family permease